MKAAIKYDQSITVAIIDTGAVRLGEWAEEEVFVSQRGDKRGK
ncbi:hypothetical protein ACFXNW_06180 [Nocardia sp. NPDC059180]